jgi:endonuclease YncB( thermonuclease family)
MRLQHLLVAIWRPAPLLIFGLVLSAAPGYAADMIVRDGDTLQLGSVTYQLDGIDAPEFDQICIDDHADPWTCGVDAREQLAKLIGGSQVHCVDLGADKSHKNRRIGICSADGATASLNQQMIRLGFALSFEPALKLHFQEDAASAKDARAGLWKGCFVAPQEFRIGKRDGALLGASCRADRDNEIRAVLFPDDLAMPPRCGIKGKFAVRARVTGNIGIYHLQGCPSYPALTKPDRWFCTEDDAQAEGFRRAYNCRASRAGK